MSPTARADLLPKRLRGRGVRVVREVTAEGRRVLVVWRDRPGAPRRYQSFADSVEGRQEAVAWARGVMDRLATVAVRAPDLTLRETWRRFEEAQGPQLRPRTLTLYAERWRKWENLWGVAFRANQTTLTMLDEFRAAMTKVHAPNQVGAMLRVVKIVYAWADSRELLTRNVTARYRFRFGKDEARLEPEEFRVEEWEAVLGALRRMGDRHWRPWAVTLLAGSLGARVRAILSLRWEDVDWVAGTVTWPKATDKTGQERTQPLTADAASALLTARLQANGPQVFWAARHPDRAMSYQSWHSAFREAETLAGVGHRPFRAAHGFRKMAAGEVWERTNDALLAMQWIGDRDPKRMREYLKRRADRLAEVARVLDEGEGSRRGGSNSRPPDYESGALPLSYAGETGPKLPQDCHERGVNDA